MPNYVRQIPSNRWAWVEVDLDAIRGNIREFKSFVKPPTRMMAVVKANAYGHGAVEVARAARSVGVDAFGVATVDEGAQLRDAGITEPILILAQPPRESVQTVVAKRLTPAVYELEFLAELGREALSHGTEAQFHLAIDTGMTRIGVACEDAAEFARVVDRLGGVRYVGTFTHFATADKTSDWDFTMQLQRFQRAVRSIRDVGVDPGTVHCANTASIVLHPEAHFDMVRLGVGLYGLHPADSTRPRIELAPAMSVHARVTRVTCPGIGEGVGYGMTYRVARPSVQIATLPIGYADGLSRRLSNRIGVLHDGVRWRQVGNICMDQCMVEIEPQLALARGARANPIEVGDEVVLVGQQGSERITLDDYAELLGTINYEVACMFGIRLPRVYVNASGAWS